MARDRPGVMAPTLGSSWSRLRADDEWDFPVEVRSRFHIGWSGGFTVASTRVDETGASWFQLRRRSDISVFNAWFPSQDVSLDRRPLGRTTR